MTSGDYTVPLRYLRNHVWKPHHRRTIPPPPHFSSVGPSRTSTSHLSLPSPVSGAFAGITTHSRGVGVNRRELGNHCLTCKHYCEYPTGDDSITAECTAPFGCDKQERDPAE